MKILTISSSYPYSQNPYSGVFVRKLMNEFVTMGCKVAVISPRKLFLERAGSVDVKENGIDVLRPKYMTVSGRKFMNVNLAKITQNNFERAVLACLPRINFIPDVVYSHFLLPSGWAALKVAQKLGKPVFCAIGESSFEYYLKNWLENKNHDCLNSFSGMIFPSVSKMKEFKAKFTINDDKLFYVRNGVDGNLFRPMDKRLARKELNLSAEEKIVIFVGSFIDRKGPLRVLNACRMLNQDIKMLFIGSGKNKLVGRDIIYAGTVEDTRLPLYINAADVFVLPTLSEGMPNAVLEAMACEKPIVTSNIDPNLELLGKDYPYYCEPMSIDEISCKVAAALNEKSRIYDDVPTLSKRAAGIMKVLKDKVV